MDRTYGPYGAVHNVENDHPIFFSPETMRFFQSRVGQSLYGGRIFITSERYDAFVPRRYTIRIATADGRVLTLGTFQQYRTSAQANKAAANWSNRLRDTLDTITSNDIHALQGEA